MLELFTDALLVREKLELSNPSTEELPGLINSVIKPVEDKVREDINGEKRLSRKLVEVRSVVLRNTGVIPSLALLSALGLRETAGENFFNRAIDSLSSRKTVDFLLFMDYTHGLKAVADQVMDGAGALMDFDEQQERQESIIAFLQVRPEGTQREMTRFLLAEREYDRFVLESMREDQTGITLIRDYARMIVANPMGDRTKGFFGAMSCSIPELYVRGVERGAELYEKIYRVSERLPKPPIGSR